MVWVAVDSRLRGNDGWGDAGMTGGVGGRRAWVGGMTGRVVGMAKGKEGNAPFVIPVETGIQR